MYVNGLGNANAKESLSKWFSEKGWPVAGTFGFVEQIVIFYACYGKTLWVDGFAAICMKSTHNPFSVYNMYIA